MKKIITDYLDKMNGDPTKDASRQNEWQYNRSLIEASLDAFITIDQNGNIKDVNKAAEGLTGISRDHLIETVFSNYFSEPQKAEIAYNQALLGGKVLNFELNIKNINGGLTPILLNASTFKNSEDLVIGVLCTFRDVTSTLKIEDELLHLKNSLEQFVKQRAAELTTANIEIAFQNEEKYKRASELVVANKELAQQSEENELYEMQTNILKEQNGLLELQKKQLDEATHLKSSFLSNMSHELRTPLNAIVGFTDLTLKTDLNTRQLNYLSKIKTLSHTLLGLISDILDLSKIEAGKLELEMTIFDLDEVLKNAENQVATKIHEKGLSLNCSIDDDVPINLRGDSLRLGQILINLVSNAVKFTTKGAIDIHVKRIETDGNDVFLEFSVKDTGIGMTETQMHKLFQPFSQADSSTSRKYGGTGLGLSISHELINMMHGKIWVNSVPNEGSTFFFTVQIEIAETLKSKHFKNKFDKWGIKVLVVEDQKVDSEIISNMLTDMTIDVTLSSSGKEALAILEKEKEQLTFDLVIIDWKMNEMDGIELAKRIKQLFAFRKLPKLMLITSHLNQGIQEKANRIGINEGVLYKPITPSLLYNSIVQVCFKDDFQESDGDTIKQNVSVNVSHLLGTKVLLVEDNEINREVVQEILQDAGLEVTLANNGQEAIDMLQSTEFDIALMDIQMPIMDGYAATREIRKNPKFDDLPIIAITANVQASDLLDCYNAGMNDHIAKPIDIDYLFHTITLWIRKSQDDTIEKAQSAASIETNPLETENNVLFESPGIDMPSGLTHLGGNQKLYLKLLNKFQKNHKHVVEEIHYAVTQKDLETASRLAHSIKGIAGNLSIYDVYQDSDTLEKALKINKLHLVDLLLEKLEQSLNQSFATILSIRSTLISRQDIIHTEVEPFQILEQFDKLETLIDDHDIESLNCMDEIVKYTSGFAFGDNIEALKEIIDQYDFDRARPVFYALNLLIRKELSHEQ